MRKISPFKKLSKKSSTKSKEDDIKLAKILAKLKPPFESLPDHLTIPDLLKPIKSFEETAVEWRHDLFLYKLKITQLMFDWGGRHSPEKEKAKVAKREQLNELVDYVGKNKIIYSQTVLVELFRMVSVNIFRYLPPSLSYSDETNHTIDENLWLHMQSVYEFFLRFLVSNDVEKKTLKQYITTEFILKILKLFDSADSRERDYLKIVLHQIYAKFMLYRSFIRKAMNNLFCIFINETQKHNGIAELLEILGGIINGFVLPIKDEHKAFLRRILIPMHKVKSVTTFHQPLSYCVTQFVVKDPFLAVPVIQGLLKFWPQVDTVKQLLFLNELEGILELTQPEEFKLLMVPLFTCLSRSIASPHFQVIERALDFWYNERISNNIADYRTDILPLIYPALSTSIQHWNKSAKAMADDVLNIFKELDQPLVQKCHNNYVKLCADREVRRVLRKQVWSILIQSEKKNNLKKEEEKSSSDLPIID